MLTHYHDLARTKSETRPMTWMEWYDSLAKPNLLGSAGLEMSLNAVPPGKAIPFLHRHRENDEGECVEVAEGSVLRIVPPAARAWRNNSDAPLYFLCLQYRADSVIQGGTLDGQRVEGKPAWPN
jgi:hypothetical protein